MLMKLLRTRHLQGHSAAAAVLLLVVNSAASAQTPPDTLLISPENLTIAKQRLAEGDPVMVAAYEKLIREADEALNTPAQSVINKPAAPSSGDMQDYVSLSPYWWPNPDTEDGLPYIRRDGEVNPERYEYDMPKLDATAKAVRYLGPAYYFSGDERYAEHAAKLLRHFFIDPETRMNPNLQFAQFIPGRNEGRQYGIIETVRLRWVPDAIRMLEGSQAWTTEDQAAIEQWFGQFQQWLVNSEFGQAELAGSNNHGSWCAQQIVLYSLFIGDEETARAVLATIPDRIASQIEPDGRQPHELERTRAFDYSDFNLRALLDLAHLGRHVDVDLFAYETDDGRSIRAAIEYLIPYATGERDWPYQQIKSPKTHTFCQALRRASAGFQEPAFEQAIGRVPDGFGEIMWYNLFEPAPEFDQ